MIKIKDIEILNEKKKEILELQKKIEKLKEVKMLKEIQQQELELQEKIKKLSIYDSEQIGNILAKLMTEFEGIFYHCIKGEWWVREGTYLIEPQSNEKDIHYIYPTYYLKDLVVQPKVYKPNSKTNKKRELSFLPPTAAPISFMESNKFISQRKSKLFPNKLDEIPYIQYFIDYLYEKRSRKLLYEISNEKLQEILQEFLEITKEEQLQRQEKNTQKIEERLQCQKRVEFEQSCVIDRKLIYNSLTYIINHYEDNMTATQEYKEDWDRTDQRSELYGYHNLIIWNENNKVYFKTEVDRQWVYPDEEYCGVHINLNKDTNICFFDLKKSIIPILKDSTFVESFMNQIECLYEEKKTILSEDIQQILVAISNKNKVKKRVLIFDPLL